LHKTDQPQQVDISTHRSNGSRSTVDVDSRRADQESQLDVIQDHRTKGPSVAPTTNLSRFSRLAKKLKKTKCKGDAASIVCKNEKNMITFTDEEKALIVEMVGGSLRKLELDFPDDDAADRARRKLLLLRIVASLYADDRKQKPDTGSCSGARWSCF
jgi:hypothetical protein